MHESHQLKLTVYMGADEIIGWVHMPANAPHGYPCRAIPKMGTMATKHFRTMDIAVNALHYHAKGFRSSQAHDVRQRAIEAVGDHINQLHDDLFALGISDLAIESMIESFINQKGFIDSVRELSIDDCLEHPPTENAAS